MGWVLGAIDDLFQGEGFLPGTSTTEVSGQRRARVEQYYAPVNRDSPAHTARMLRVFEEVLAALDQVEARDELVDLLARDGFAVDEVGRIRPSGDQSLASLVARSDLPSGVRVQIDRIQNTVDTDPEAAIGAAKELVEATTKYVLDTLDVSYGNAPKLPELVRLAQSALGVHPESVAPDRDGFETIKIILGSLAQLPIRLNDLRQPYGTGHGRPQRPSGLHPRHAHLAVGAAAVYCRFLLDTIEDPKAPWRHDVGRRASDNAPALDGL